MYIKALKVTAKRTGEVLFISIEENRNSINPVKPMESIKGENKDQRDGRERGMRWRREEGGPRRS